MTDLDTNHLKNEIKEELTKENVFAQLEEEQSISLSELLDIIKRDKLFIIYFTIIAGLISVILSFCFPNYYKSSASIYVFFNGKSSALKGFLNRFNMESIADSNNVSLLTSSLNSDSMKGYIINKFGIATNPAIVRNNTYENDETAYDKILRKFNKIVNINYDPSSNLIIITAETMSATTSADIVNAYLEKLELYSYGPQKSKLVFIEKQLEKAKLELEKAENDLKNFQEKNSYFSIDKQISSKINNLAYLESKKNDADISLSFLDVYSNNLVLEEMDLKQLNAQKEAEKAKSNTINYKIKQNENELASIPSISIEYARLERNLMVKEKIFTILNEQKEIAKIEDAEEGYQYKIIDRPRIAKLKSKPQRAVFCILVTFCSFIFSICFVVIRNFTKKKNLEE